MYILNYNKTTNIMFDISKEKKEHFWQLEITEEDKKEILNKMNQGLTCYIDKENNIFYFKEYFCECAGLEEVKSIRDELLAEQTFFHMPMYQEKLLAIDNIVVDMDILKEYYFRLHTIEVAYTDCTDKENFKIIMVDEYSEDEDETIFEIVKPSFIK